jgi:DNA-binding response OmpR family regulator
VSYPQVSVLVVEDDPGIATQLVRGLERAGYTADSVGMGADALRRAPSDVVLLDLGLPDIDGVDVCRQLREASDAAIIVVTARGEEADRVLALDEGADDYLVKPFGLAELLARIRAVLRRGQRLGGGTEVLRHGPLTVDLRTRKVTVSGAEIALTPKEFAILECLAADPGSRSTPPRTNGTRSSTTRPAPRGRWPSSLRNGSATTPRLRRCLPRCCRPPASTTSCSCSTSTATSWCPRACRATRGSSSSPKRTSAVTPPPS